MALINGLWRCDCSALMPNRRVFLACAYASAGWALLMGASDARDLARPLYSSAVVWSVWALLGSQMMLLPLKAHEDMIQLLTATGLPTKIDPPSQWTFVIGAMTFALGAMYLYGTRPRHSFRRSLGLTFV